MSTAVGLAFLVSLVALEGITATGSGCPEGYFNPSGSSSYQSQCFKYYETPKLNWTDAREFCIKNGLSLAIPNDFVNLGELSTYLKFTFGLGGAWLGARGSAGGGAHRAAGFLWEAGSSRRELPSSDPGWRGGQPGSYCQGNECCLLIVPWGESSPYFPQRCGAERSILCQQ